MCFWFTVLSCFLAVEADFADVAFQVDARGSVAPEVIQSDRNPTGAHVADAVMGVDASGSVYRKTLMRTGRKSNFGGGVIQPDGNSEPKEEEEGLIPSGCQFSIFGILACPYVAAKAALNLIPHLTHSKDQLNAHESKHIVRSFSALEQPPDHNDEQEQERHRQQQERGPQNATLIVLTGVTGKIGNVWTKALHAEDPRGVWGSIMKVAGTYLQQHQLIMKEDECGDCEKIGVDQARACCVIMMQFGAVVSNLELLSKDEPLELSISLASDYLLSPELVQLLRSLKLSAGMYKTMCGHLKKNGIFKTKQLEGLDPSKMADEMSLDADDPLRALMSNMLLEGISQAEAERNYDGDSKTSLTSIVKGEQWDVQQLIRRNGLFRGLRIANPGQDYTNLQEAVQFNGAASLASNRALETSILIRPDRKTSEINLESTNLYSLNSANMMMESFGSSSLHKDTKSWSTNLGIDGNVFGIPAGFSWGWSSNKKSERKLQEDGNFRDEAKLNEKVNRYAKSRYFIEPRQMIIVDPAWLQPTPALRNAFQKVKESFVENNETKKYSVDVLFREFGTHTCTRALLGGWWKIQATIKSAEKVKAMTLSTAVTKSIDNLVEKSSNFNFKGQAFGVTFGAERKKLDSTHDKENSEKQNQNQETVNTNNTMSELAQEWKGGISGLQAEAWRASLDESMNSNWKIIDRFVDDCRGIWRWVEDDDELKERICEGWRQEFMRNMAEHGVTADFAQDKETEWSSCKGEAYMQGFRSRVMDERRAVDEEKMKAKAIECESTPGTHWDGDSCVPNICKCGPYEGALGTECPKHGAEKCKADQHAKCRTMSCPRGYWKKPSQAEQAKNCRTHKCNLDDDLDTCCQPIVVTDTFTIEVWSKKVRKGGKASKARVKWWLEGKDGYQTHKGDIGEGPWEGKHKDYTVKSDHMMQAKKICLDWTRHRFSNTWCIGETIAVYNSHLGKSPSSRVGEATGFVKFHQKRQKQCHEIVYKPIGV